MENVCKKLIDAAAEKGFEAFVPEGSDNKMVRIDDPREEGSPLIVAALRSDGGFTMYCKKDGPNIERNYGVDSKVVSYEFSADAPIEAIWDSALSDAVDMGQNNILHEQVDRRESMLQRD